MSFVIDFIELRRPKLEYVSPPICEFIFSGSGVLIVLEPLKALRSPTGLQIGGVGHLTLSWNNYPGALCYTVYKAVDSSNPFGAYVIVAECINDPHIIINPGCYRVSAITLEGESALSDPICNTTVIPPEAQTDAATGVSGNAATLRGEVFGNGAPTTAFFQYGTSIAYGTSTPGQSIGAGPAIAPISQAITGLSFGTTYHFRTVATNVNGTSFGLDKQFVAQAGDTPTVTVLATIPDAYESGTIPGRFTIHRAGDTSNANTVHFTLTGTALNGVDYVSVPLSILMGAGVTDVFILITPIDELLTGMVLTAILTLVPFFGESYVVGTPSAATVNIHENDSANAPCSIFTADNTSQGQRTLPIGAGTVTWPALAIGSYQFKYIDHTFLIYTNPCSDGCQQSFGISMGQFTWGTSNGQSGGFPDQNSITTQCICQPPGILAPYFTSDAAATTDYHTRAMPSAFFLGEIYDGFITIQQPSVAQPGGPQPIFELIRKLRLTTPQPKTLQILNFSTYVNGRFQVVYQGEASGAIALDASAFVVQTALNAMAPITADGGVTCAGSLNTGMTVTWNINGLRTMIAPEVATINPGIISRAVENQTGNAFQPEIQLLTVGPFCADFNVDNALPEYDGSIGLRDLNLASWFANAAPNANTPTKDQSNFQWLDTYVRLITGPLPPVAAATVTTGGGGNIDAGAHKWKITFSDSTGESGGGPESAQLTLGVSSQVNLTNIPIGPVNTTKRNIYRTLAGGLVYYLVGTINDNTTTAFADNVSDAGIFQSGFGAPIKPASCFWMMGVMCVFNIASVIFLSGVVWSGIKLTGPTPIGTYVLSYPWGNLPGSTQQCPVLPQTGGVPSITLTGTF